MTTEKAVTAEALRAALKRGAGNGQRAGHLAFALGTTERAIRNLTDELIEAGTPVCAHPSTGYFIAETLEEAQAASEFHRGRGLHSLKKASQIIAAFTSGGVDPITQLEQEGAFAS